MTKVDRFYVKQRTNGVENYFNKSHITLEQATPTGGTDRLEYVAVWYDPNMPLMIGPPPTGLIDEFRQLSLGGVVPGTQSLAARMRGRLTH